VEKQSRTNKNGRWTWERIILATLLMAMAPILTRAQEVAAPGNNGGKAIEIAAASPEKDSQSTAGPAPAPADSSNPWLKIPPIYKTPRTGNFAIAPSGPGYYSLEAMIMGNYRDKPPVMPWPPTSADAGSFFDNDFRYLEKPDNTQHDFLDFLKRCHPTCDWLLSIGGEERFRWAHELDSRLSGKDNNYQLLRSRVYADLWFQDFFRVYAEFIDARSYNQNLAPLAIDVNHSDLLNLFGELKVYELDGTPIYIRVGRQELLYGSERLISPLDWVNTRRTFQGVKGYYHSEKLDVDLFWVQPIIIDPIHFDSPDDGQHLAGAWTTYRPQKGQAIDLYYLYLDNTRPVAIGSGGARGGFNVNTFGTRYAGDKCQFLWDFEGMLQFGDWSNLESISGAYTTGLGYNFADMPLNPTFWVYWDWAKGDHNPGIQRHTTFNQLFPFGHYYFGFIDVVGRQNIQDFNLHCYFYPTNWVTTGVQYHMFRLESARDALYNAAGAPIRRDPTGNSGSDVGDEVDFTTNFHLDMHKDVLVGYSKLYAGEFIKRTGSPRSPEYFYLQYSFRW